MTWMPIIAAVDASEESAEAAMFAALLADRTASPLHLVNAVPEYWTAVPPIVGLDVAELNRQSVEHARRLVSRTLEQQAPKLAAALECRVGNAALVLRDVAEEHHASVVIMGGKRHRALGRLLGSTIVHLARMGAVPVLAHDGKAARITRVLAAVDLSAAAQPTIEAAANWAAAFKARLRVLHVIEPIPMIPGIALSVPDDELYRQTQAHAEQLLRPLLPGRAELVLRRGRAAAGIVMEAREWGADLIVTGSHGKQFMERLVMGSTSERLLHVLPAPTLVVPVGHTGAVRPAAIRPELAIA